MRGAGAWLVFTLSCVHNMVPRWALAGDLTNPAICGISRFAQLGCELIGLQVVFMFASRLTIWPWLS